MRLAFLLLVGSLLQARVFLVSLDGMAWDTFAHDPVGQELTALHALARRGVEAQGMRPHFPSTTSNSHAALFNGAWGDVNGITGNSMPVSPRRDHTAFERIEGFRSDGLRSEPIWVAAGRQGISTVAMEVTQAFPFRPQSVGQNLKTPPFVVNGYQTRTVAPYLVLRESDVQTEACPAPGPQVRCFHWMAGPIALHGMLRFGNGVIASLEIRAAESPAPVTATAAPLESGPPRERDLARRFSAPLFLPNVPQSSAAALYFRLFECSADGAHFLVYQSPLQELGIHYGEQDGRALARQLIQEAGGFVGNGPESAVTKGPFTLGLPAWKGGDGTAERRYLEICELITRQSMQHARWLLKHQDPMLFVGYLSLPDETEHAWRGLAAESTDFDRLRRWAYTIVNRYVEFYQSAATENDDLVFVSDHGMAPITRNVAINAAFRKAGLLQNGPNGKPDPARTQAVELRNCVLINSTDWKNGIVAPEQRASVIERVKQALTGIRDPATQQQVITRIYDSPEDAVRFGFGGPNGADLCFDLLPGYATTLSSDLPLIRKRTVAGGEHGFDPTRLEMKAILIGAGPHLPQGTKWQGVRSIDVAPLIAQLLGIDPPRNARGTSPMRKSEADPKRAQ